MVCIPTITTEGSLDADGDGWPHIHTNTWSNTSTGYSGGLKNKELFNKQEIKQSIRSDILSIITAHIMNFLHPSQTGDMGKWIKLNVREGKQLDSLVICTVRTHMGILR